jgi:dolichol-phosphate mannosyltransferase
MPLLAQGAYYWYFSLKPALSYFDHPPLAAYSIWFGTFIFGKSIFGMAINFSMSEKWVFSTIREEV